MSATLIRCPYRKWPLHFGVKRGLTIRPAKKFYRTFYDEGIALSGIEIAVTDNQFGAEAKKETIFLSMGELSNLLEALRSDLSVYFEQYDWSED